MKNSRLLPIVLVVFVDVLGFAIVIPLLPFYAEHYGASPAQVGMLVSIYAVFSLLGAPLLGRWSDHYGRKPILLISQLGTFTGFVMLALAPSLAWVFAARALDGITAANIATARAYISDVTAPQERTRAFGWIGAAFGFGFLIGPAGAGMLARHGLQWPLWAAAALSAASILATATLLPRRVRSVGAQPTRRRELGWAFLRDPAIDVRLWQLLAYLFSFSLFTSGFALFCERRLTWHAAPFGTTQVGYVLAYVGLLGLIAQLVLLPRWVARFGEARLAAASLLAGALGYLLLGSAYGLVVLLLSLTLAAIANSVVRPSLLGLISLNVSPQRQGAVFGFSQILQSLAMIAGPLVSGTLIEFGWLTGWAVACAVPLLLALLLSIWRGRVSRAG